MNYIKKTVMVGVVTMVTFYSIVPIYATESEVPTEKEEVVYITLKSDDTLKDTYVVNSFAGGDITDYGNYDSIKMLNTSDVIMQNGEMITFSTDANKVYYQGEIKEAEIPWNIELHYYLDGKEYRPDEIAGKSGQLEIYFQISKNEQCTTNFFDNYALQASFTLNTEQFSNIDAPNATIASVGEDKQLTYTILPGEGIDTKIEAVVTDFEMPAVTINGIQLNLNVEIDDTLLKEKVNELILAVNQLDEGEKALSNGSTELLEGTAFTKDGASSLNDGMIALDQGVDTLHVGMDRVQEGLDVLNTSSPALTTGSAEFQTALINIQSALNSISTMSEDLTKLTTASSEIKTAINQLYEGAALLQNNLGYPQYKTMMLEMDIDGLKKIMSK